MDTAQKENLSTVMTTMNVPLMFVTSMKDANTTLSLEPFVTMAMPVLEHVTTLTSVTKDTVLQDCVWIAMITMSAPESIVSHLLDVSTKKNQLVQSAVITTIALEQKNIQTIAITDNAKLEQKLTVMITILVPLIPAMMSMDVVTTDFQMETPVKAMDAKDVENAGMATVSLNTLSTVMITTLAHLIGVTQTLESAISIGYLMDTTAQMTTFATETKLVGMDTANLDMNWTVMIMIPAQKTSVNNGKAVFTTH